MGRKVRMVPVNWEHPRNSYGNFQPMFDQTFADAAREWKDGFAAWENGDRPSHCEDVSEYWEYHGTPPDREYYRPWSDEDAVWFQVWETVSEGTPVTPPFASREELINYLATQGDFWDQRRGDGAWNYESAKAFVNAGWAPSVIMTDGEVLTPRDGIV